MPSPPATTPQRDPARIAAAAALLADWAARCERTLEALLAPPADDADPRPAHLVAAMRHAVLGGGKRLRPLLVHAAGHACGAAHDALAPAAAALELVHAYSLVHDDLPAMDDDALRRGQPTVHVAFDEATAILAGDALQALAFEAVAEAGALPAAVRVALLARLARAAGVAGMCGGQAIDLAATGAHVVLALPQLERLHALKTGALIEAAVMMGAEVGGADAATRDALQAYARALGLAFQVRDDILDVEGSSAELGKTAGKDAAQDKSTYPALLGMDASKALLAELAARMDAALAPLDARADALRALAEMAVHRRH